MSMSIPALVLYIAIAAICGAIGKAFAGDPRGGLVISIMLGLVGGILGSWIAFQLKLPDPLVVSIGGQPLGILWTIIGSAAIVGLVHLFSGRRRFLGRAW